MGALVSKRVFAATMGDNRKTGQSLAAGTYYTRPMTFWELSRVAVQFKYGATTATVRLQTSNDPDAKKDLEGASAGSGVWYDETLTPPADPAGVAGNMMWHISDMNADYYRFKIVVASGTSDWFGWVSGKQ